MNGWKPLIFLEEVEADYDLTAIDFDKGEQKSEWYLALNPNGRIPTLVDRSNDNFVVFESGAILWYLAERYNQFLPDSQKARSQTLQWLMFQMGGVGPMMGQAMYFQRIAVPQGHHDDFAIRRYVEESRRLLEVLDKRLTGRSFVVGHDYTIADMALYPWVRSYFWAKLSIEGLDHLKAWLDRLDGRAAIKRAMQKPAPFPAFFGEGDVEAAVAINSARFVRDA